MPDSQGVVGTPRARLPGRSEAAPVFAACVVPVFSWSLLWFFQELPGLLRYLTAWDIMSILAYSQAFALIESAIILIIITVLAAFLPPSLFRTHFVPQGSIVVLMMAFWTMLFQLIFEAVIRNWSFTDFFLWFGLAFVSILLAALLVRRSTVVAKAVAAFTDRLTVLLYVYTPLGISGIVIVLLRNLS